VAADAELSAIVDPIWADAKMMEVPRQGVSFWMRMK